MAKDDRRSENYRNLTEDVLSKTVVHNRASADRILQVLFEYVRPSSVLDVGCGLGTWLKAVLDLGISDIRGVEGNWLDRSKLEIDGGLVEVCDLEHGFSLGRKFDLTICLEVGEHLSPAAAEGFVRSLVNHSDVILFSAAIPYQRGADHRNERFPDYWAKFF